MNADLLVYIKIFGFITAGSGLNAGFSSPAGHNLSTFRQNILPFGHSPQAMIRMAHNVAIHTTAYALLGPSATTSCKMTHC